jgi:hypothetical protein
MQQRPRPHTGGLALRWTSSRTSQDARPPSGRRGSLCPHTAPCRDVMPIRLRPRLIDTQHRASARGGVCQADNQPKQRRRHVAMGWFGRPRRLHNSEQSAPVSVAPTILHRRGGDSALASAASAALGDRRPRSGEHRAAAKAPATGFALHRRGSDSALASVETEALGNRRLGSGERRAAAEAPATGHCTTSTRRRFGPGLCRAGGPRQSAA